MTVPLNWKLTHFTAVKESSPVSEKCTVLWSVQLCSTHVQEQSCNPNTVLLCGIQSTPSQRSTPLHRYWFCKLIHKLVVNHAITRNRSNPRNTRCPSHLPEISGPRDLDSTKNRLVTACTYAHHSICHYIHCIYSSTDHWSRRVSLVAVNSASRHIRSQILFSSQHCRTSPFQERLFQ